MTTEEVETDLVKTPEKVVKNAPGEAHAPESERGLPKSRNLSRWISLLVLALIVIGSSLWWLDSQGYESTDDAQIEGHLDSVSARISGTVTYINPQVENNQFVEAGTLLMALDPRDYEADLEHARANLNTRTAEAHSAQVTVPIVDASAFGQLHSAEASHCSRQRRRGQPPGRTA
jgi:membrane fusion protein (multidrug efflux system)